MVTVAPTYPIRGLTRKNARSFPDNSHSIDLPYSPAILTRIAALDSLRPEVDANCVTVLAKVGRGQGNVLQHGMSHGLNQSFPMNECVHPQAPGIVWQSLRSHPQFVSGFRAGMEARGQDEIHGKH